MAPPPTAADGDLLEHPAQVFDYYRQRGVSQVLCEEKHMGSRAVLVVCRDTTVARHRFHATGEEAGICYTRTGRRFFNDLNIETALLDRLRDAFNTTDLWGRLQSDWVCLDAELMPWSAKAQELIRSQYAPLAAAAGASLANAEELLHKALERGVEVSELLKSHRSRRQQIAQYVKAYSHYCWPVDALEDLALAPFHLLASEGQVHSDKPHPWHMELLHEICAASPEILHATACLQVDLEDQESCNRAIEEWQRLTAAGGEGMVIKPLEFIPRNQKGILQPAIKCRGREYLRIIYGPEYTAPLNLERLRKRHLGRKRSLALREFALGLEALERFVEKRPLREVHECVFGVLALESEPVDPRL
jgi:protein phosphatase